MEQVFQPIGISALRSRLHTWIHDLVDRYRSLRRQVMRRSEGEAFLLRRYFRIHGKPLNLVNPQTFTEKLFWRMITWNRGIISPRFTHLTDKYTVRAHVASTVGEKYLTKLLWHGDNPRAIPFDRLPAEYVIKPSHASGHVIIVNGQADQDKIIQTVTGWMANNYYWQAREYQYYGIKRGIVIEECLRNQDGTLPFDYKFTCFNGIPELIEVQNPTKDINPFFDTTWSHLDLTDDKRVPRPWVPKPPNLAEMLALAAKLSAGFGYVRVDLFNVIERVYFGELTFTTAGGIVKYCPDFWDLKLGEKWDLSLDR